jgi:hypothetical protein
MNGILGVLTVVNLARLSFPLSGGAGPSDAGHTRLGADPIVLVDGAVARTVTP